MQRKEIFIGVDVSKQTLDVAIYGTRNHLRIANHSEGFKHLQAWLKSLQIALSECWFVLEYTGGYEYRLVQFCQSKRLTFTRVPGLEIKKSLGMQRGKNDKIDAQRIADYGYQKRDRLKVHKTSTTLIESLKELLTQRRGFVKQRKANEHRMNELIAMKEPERNKPVIKNYGQAIRFEVKMIKKIEADIVKLIEKDETVERNFKLLTTIPGIGKVNAWMTIAHTDNFERFSNGRKYGANAGVVPYEHTSGKSIKGKSRVSHMANKEIKAELDMAARAAVTHDPEMQAYYQRRVAMGKHHNSIKNEVKFKLILRMFAVVNKQEVYVKNQMVAA
jgi:transposase